MNFILIWYSRLQALVVDNLYLGLSRMIKTTNCGLFEHCNYCKRKVSDEYIDDSVTSITCVPKVTIVYKYWFFVLFHLVQFLFLIHCLLFLLSLIFYFSLLQSLWQLYIVYIYTDFVVLMRRKANINQAIFIRILFISF